MKTFACGDVVPGCSASFSAVDARGRLAGAVTLEDLVLHLARLPGAG